VPRSAEMRPLTLGTAGHIDHGKTALVRALTGKDTDRLAEEHRRGISIELGYAQLELPGGRRISLIDVPGHEALVRTMVAGATGIDLFLLVVAADEGVMPQTREHLTVLRALGVRTGVVVITRCDLADPERRRRSAAEALELLDAPQVEVSAHTGEGLDRLLAALAEAAERADGLRPQSPWHEPAVLHVDRVFTLRGIGTVVTGTLWSGELATGGAVQVLPSAVELRIRSIQVHDRSADRVGAGQRVALNLAGANRDRVGRGDVVCSTDAPLEPAYRLDVELEHELDLAGDERRVQVHHGTRHAPARVVRLGDAMAQLRLESPLIALAGDRFVIRRVAPPETLGGGRVIDPRPARHGPGPARERLRLIAQGEPAELLEVAIGEEADVPADPALWERHPLLGPARRRWTPELCRRAVADLLATGRVRESRGLLTAPGESRPSRAPVEPGERALRAAELLARDDASPRSPAALAEELGCDRDEALSDLETLAAAGLAVRVKPAVYYEAGKLDVIRRRLLDAAAASGGEITLAEAKVLLGTSRKYAQALLEHLDSTHLTVRQGDRHVLRRSARAAESAGAEA
jgi:selenocysteine-specific elongation factor